MKDTEVDIRILSLTCECTHSLRWGLGLLADR